MSKPNMEGKVCVNHTDTHADSRCTSCFKPLCNVCIIAVQSEDFCSKECANKHFQNLAKHVDMGGKPSAIKSLIRIIIYLAVLGGLAFAVWHFVLNKKPAEKSSIEHSIGLIDA